MNRGHHHQRPEEAEAERDRATLAQLPHDRQLLAAQDRVDLTQNPRQLAVRPVGAIDESEHADREGQQRHDREEELERDRTGEEGALIRDEGVEHRPRAAQDHAHR